MLAELALYALSPAPLAIHQAGLVREAVGLWARARRCRAVWAPHEAECHRAVAAAVAEAAGRRSVLVLGSGLVRDVPIKLLATAFQTVMLADAVHLLPARLKTLSRRNVRHVAAELTGRLGGVTGSAATVIADLAAQHRPDLVISANVLSQLPLPFPEAARAGIVAEHLAGLRALPCPALLLTDTDELTYDASGRLTDRLDLLHGITLPPAMARWNWLLAPKGELDGGATLVHPSGSWLINPPRRG